MLKKLTAFLTAAVMVTSVASIPVLTSYADTNSTTEKRVMEKLDRGTVAVKTNDGVYLSWRLLGTESLTNQAFDIYRDSEKIYTTGEHDATCYTDSKGTADNKYTVVPKGEAIDKTEAVDVWTTNTTYKGRSVAYKDIAFKVPDGGKTPTDEEYTYTANDMSVGDLDGDGEYEYIVKWDPSNSKDNSVKGYTGNVYLDAYELDGTLLWRIDLGVNIRAGAHYTQYMVYDFDGDGKSEVILKTAPGSKDGEGNYVSKAGKNITKGDDKKDYRNSSGLLMGKDGGPEYLTVFNGETGAAMQTVDFDPPRSILTSSKWGDSYANRSERYLAAVAYLDGVHPSVVMTRGYYTYVYAAAYTWDGTDLKEQWLSTNTPTEANGGTGCTVKYADGTSKNNTNKTLYAQGAHSVSVADVDNDGYDEIIFGSAVLDHDGTVLTYDGRGHGDAEHVSDFDNDGKQEIFMAHEAGKHNDKIIPYAVDIKRYNGDIMLQAAQGDIGRGIMDNVDDEYALSSGNLSLFWSVAADGIYNQAGEKVGDIPNSHGSNMENFAVYWDGDLGRELLDGNKLVKYSVTSGTERIYCNSKNATLPGSINNSTKSNACLTADLFGDWREEIVLRYGDGVRIYFSTIPTDYRLTTLMHDSQYRCAIAWQNVGYNQSPHTSYYIGSAALAKDSGGNTLNYLAPNTSFTEVTYPDTSSITPRPTIKTTPEPVSVSVTADADTYLVDGTTAHGSDEELKINQATDYYSSTSPGLKDIKGLGLIRFDLSKYAGKKLTSATLKLYDKFTNTDKRNSVLHLDYCSKNDWDEATVTINDIKTRGEGTPLSSLGLQVSPAYNVDYKEISFDVTDVIKEKCTDNLITFTLWTGTGREQVIASKEYSGTDAQGPTLVLEFEGEEPTPTPTVVPTATPTLKPTATPTVVPTATPTLKPTTIPTAIPTATPNLANNKITAMINSNNKLDVTLDFENVDMNDVNVYVAFKNNGKLVGMKMPQASELKGIDLIDKEYTDIEVYAWDNKQKPYANIVRIVNNVQ
ncbi:cellulosome protein dockerin type I [Firmicutes bacterium CAG:41]|nr:cellulosome protein dockerin type I [Firmicutes bacterium CAG:41]